MSNTWLIAGALFVMGMIGLAVLALTVSIILDWFRD